jgi:hypothetical protein
VETEGIGVGTGACQECETDEEEFEHPGLAL